MGRQLLSETTAVEPVRHLEENRRDITFVACGTLSRSPETETKTIQSSRLLILQENRFVPRDLMQESVSKLHADVFAIAVTIGVKMIAHFCDLMHLCRRR